MVDENRYSASGEITDTEKEQQLTQYANRSINDDDYDDYDSICLGCNTKMNKGIGNDTLVLYLNLQNLANIRQTNSVPELL